MPRRLAIIITLVLTTLALGARIKPLSFDNPGNRRLLKLEDSSYYYFRSLPEKSMTLNVDGIERVELRSFAIENLRKPQVIAVINGKKTTYDLKLNERLDGFYLYQSVTVPIPAKTKSIEILCYERSIYFRAFHNVIEKTKIKPAKPANLIVRGHGGIISVAHNGTENDYYTFNQTQSLKFSLNNGRTAVVYVRARLLDRTLPSFSLYANGKLLETREFSLKRTTKYKAVGINFLTVGIKLELPENSGTTEIELRATSDHLFLARPVLVKGT